jgi:hypothetical protein
MTAAAGLPTVELLLHLLRDYDAMLARHGGAARIPATEREAWEARKREVIARINAARR